MKKVLKNSGPVLSYLYVVYYEVLTIQLHIFKLPAQLLPTVK